MLLTMWKLDPVHLDKNESKVRIIKPIQGVNQNL